MFEKKRLFIWDGVTVIYSLNMFLALIIYSQLFSFLSWIFVLCRVNYYIYLWFELLVCEYCYFSMFWYLLIIFLETLFMILLKKKISIVVLFPFVLPILKWITSPKSILDSRPILQCCNYKILNENSKENCHFWSGRVKKFKFMQTWIRHKLVHHFCCRTRIRLNLKKFITNLTY